MKERIILAPELNANEIIKSLALNGVNCFNIRFCSGVELARIALMRSGVIIPEDYLTSDEGMI